MTKDEALRLAWDALEDIGDEWGFTSNRTVSKRKEAITAIKESLKQPEQEPCCYGGIAHDCHAGGGCRIVKRMKAAQPEQEPVAWISAVELMVMRANALAGAKDWRVNVGLVEEEGDVGLYISPPQRTWITLTDEEFLKACQLAEDGNYLVAFQRIQQWLKEKNK